MLDVASEIRAYLVTQTALTTLVGGATPRIWAERVMPPAGYNPGMGGGIAFRTRGGNVDYATLLNPSVQFKCYAANEQAANAVYRALFDALQEAKSAKIRQALCEILGQTLDEPDTGWPFVLTFFRFWF